MNLEIILWIAAGIIISEIIFILWTIKSKNLHEFDFWEINWVYRKFVSLVIGGLFTFIQVIITYDYYLKLFHYEYLLYEVLILGGIAGLFLINYFINKMINKETKKTK